MINYYPINEELARRANNMNSRFDCKVDSAAAEYRRSVDEAARIAEEQKQKVDPFTMNGSRSCPRERKRTMRAGYLTAAR